MGEILSKLFESSESFMPHGHCYLWQSSLVWLHASTDTLIFFSYLAISGMLAYLVCSLKELPFHSIYILFGVFIFACGLTHALEVLNIWIPTYWLSGSVKAMTAIASVATAIILPWFFPKIRMLAKGAALLEAQTALKMSEAALKNITETIPQIVWTAKADGNIDYYNQRWFDYTGMTFEQSKDWGWEPVVHPDDLQNCLQLWSHSVKTGEAYEIEYRFKRADDGEYRWHLGRATPIHDSKGKVVKWFGTCTDIHMQRTISEERTLHIARELASVEIHRSKEFLDRVIGNLPTSVFIKGGADLSIVRVNRAAEELLGLSDAELIGKSHYDFYPKDQADLFTQRDRAILSSSGKIELRESPIQTRYKGERFLSTKLMAIIGPDGDRYLLEIAEDITDRKQQYDLARLANDELELKVVARTRELSMVAESIPHLVWIISGEGSAIYFNQRWTDYTGCSVDVPTTWEEIIHPDDISDSRAAWEKSLRSGAEYSVEYRIRRRTDGAFRWHLTRALPILDANLKVIKWFGTCTDIQDQKEVQLALNQTKSELEAIANKFKQVVYSNMIGVIFWNAAGGITEANDAFLEMIGYTRADLESGKLNWSELSPSEHRWKDTNMLKELASHGVCVPYEKEYFHKNGNRITIVVGAALFPGQHDNGICFVLDRTEMKRAEDVVRLKDAALIDTENQFHTLANSMPHLAWMGLPDGSNYWYNQGWYDYTGTQVGEMDGARWISLHDPAILPEVLRRWSESCRVGSAFEMEFPLKGKDGSFRWFLTRVTPVRNGAGEISKWFGTATDVHEQRRLLSSVEMQKDRLQRLISTSVIAVALSDREGRVSEANESFLELTGYTKSDLADGKINRQTQTPEELTGASRHGLEAFFKYGRCEPFEKLLPRKDGTLVPVLIGFSDLGTDRNDVVTWMMNLTQLKQAEQQKTMLELREKAALESTRIKSEFLATMSHEIRTPINGVIGMTSLLMDTGLTSEQISYGEAIRSSADTLLTLVNDILDLSKAEAGKIDLEIINFDLEQVIVDIERTLGFAAKKKNLRLLKSVSTDLPAYLKGDPTRLRQVLANLVNNAIKFTTDGQVTIQVYNDFQDGDKIRLRFEVGDTGIGIPDESLSRMFQAFSQADPSTTRKFGGTGLGLSISKHLVTLMGGEIGVTSSVGVGSTFWFTIPCKIGSGLLSEACSSQESDARVQRKLRILVAEDNSINQTIAIKMLEKLGHSAVAVGNGNEVIDALRTTPYDLVFMDCQMPEMDGYEATRTIRSMKTLECHDIPIIAMTANAMSGDREKCIEAGMSDYVSKPMKVKDLAMAIDRNLTSKTHAA